MSNPLPVFQPLAPPGAAHVIEVGFKGIRRGFYLSDNDEIADGDLVIVEAERGIDLGRVRSRGGVARSKCSSSGSEASARLLRLATPDEVRQSIVLRADEDRVRRQARELVDRQKLRMKVTDSEWQWDKNKLTIYFTAERRVDFRELVRDLARTFRTRIELKQIGVRDEAALLGGLGRCGRQLCCATWLREIRPVSLQLAKDQNLSLNPSQISGTCGRLMCCLTYEHDAYVQARKRFPREGKLLQTSRGQERVIGVDIWRECVTLLDEARQRRVVPLAELKAEIAPRGAAEGQAAARRSEPSLAPQLGPTADVGAEPEPHSNGSHQAAPSSEPESPPEARQDRPQPGAVANTRTGETVGSTAGGRQRRKRKRNNRRRNGG